MSEKNIVQTIREELDKRTSIPFARFKLTPDPVTIFSSKVGGKPYLPKNEKIPTNPEGETMRLVAQINCEDIKEMPYYPHEGMLEFFICGECWGIDFDDPTSGKDFRVVYYPSIDRTVNESDIPDIPEDDLFPISGEYGMKFEFGKQGIQATDYRFNGEFKEAMGDRFPESESKEFCDLPDEVIGLFFETGNDENHQIGGYPFFTQNDPREYGDEKLKKFDWLLFQLDSDRSGADVMWGDVGVANFMISLEDLKNLNFNNILYNWDCC